MFQRYTLADKLLIQQMSVSRPKRGSKLMPQNISVLVMLRTALQFSRKKLRKKQIILQRLPIQSTRNGDLSTSPARFEETQMCLEHLETFRNNPTHS